MGSRQSLTDHCFLARKTETEDVSILWNFRTQYAVRMSTVTFSQHLSERQKSHGLGGFLPPKHSLDASPETG